MQMPWESAIIGLTSLASEWIEDKDKRNEFIFKVQELEFKMRETLLTTTTTPKVDALVKLLIAFRDILLPLLRPVGAACMTAFGMYCHIKGIDIGETGQIVMDAAFPSWGASRHINKQKEETEKTKRHRAEQNDPFWFEE